MKSREENRVRAIDQISEETKQDIIRHLDDAGLFPDWWTSAAFDGADEARRKAIVLFLEEREVDEDKIVRFRERLLVLAELVKLQIEDLDVIRSDWR